MGEEDLGQGEKQNADCYSQAEGIFHVPFFTNTMDLRKKYFGLPP